MLLCKTKFKDKNSFTCILSCCKSCSFCRRVAAKERCKSRSSKSNKICERCFLYKSLEFCTKCHKCPTCCTKSTCRRQITPVLGKMGSPRRQPQSTSSPQRRLHTSLPVPAQSDKKSHNNKLLCKSPQEQLPVGGIASAVRQKCCRIGSKSTVPGLLQPVISGTQTQQPVATYLGSEHTEQSFENTVFQNGDSRDNKNLTPGRGVGDLNRLQRRILAYKNKQPVQEVHALSYPRRDLSIQSTTLWSVHSSHGIYSGGQRGEISCNEKGYKNSPVPRRLVGQSQIPPNLSATHTNLGSSLLKIGLASERGKIRAGADCTGIAQHALVLGSSGNVQSDSPVSAQHIQSSVSAIQPGPTQEPVKSDSTCLAPGASAIKEQGFSEAVAARIEAPQTDLSMRQSGPFLCLSNQVDLGHHI